jgi:hypothetical protein
MPSRPPSLTARPSRTGSEPRHFGSRSPTSEPGRIPSSTNLEPPADDAMDEEIRKSFRKRLHERFADITKRIKRSSWRSSTVTSAARQ